MKYSFIGLFHDTKISVTALLRHTSDRLKPLNVSGFGSLKQHANNALVNSTQELIQVVCSHIHSMHRIYWKR